ncbi:MAG: hypothetical protein Q8P81_04355 [Nanoarchaeota archaeon]|nr:hypothetical protein [Nanoarchaeota archaeon]
MSDMLEKAIIDANALREVAVKKAESQIIEKYAPKIKEAIEQLLEMDPEEEIPGEGVQDLEGDGMGGMGDMDPGSMGMGADMGDHLGATSSEDSKIAEQIPMAAMDGQCADCKDDEQEIEIDFSELERQMNGEKDADMSDMTDRGELASELPTPEEEIPMEEEILSLEENEECDKEEKEDKEESLENLDEETLREIVEALEVDFQPKLDGWFGTNDTKKAESLEGVLAAAQSDENEEAMKDMKKAIENLQEDIKKIKLDKEKISKENEELKINLKKVVVTLNESNVVNAKLLYTNKILGDVSLNEKQKKVFVESLSKSDSVDKAKVIYETLLGSAGNANVKAGPKSLNEVVSRPSMTSPIKPNSEKVISDPYADRMKVLAGIKK